jgi:hypothetical protein
MKTVVTVALLMTVLQSAACSRGSRGGGVPGPVQDEDLRPELARVLRSARRQVGSPRVDVTRAGSRRDSVVLVAPCELRVPAAGTGRRVLRLTAAPVFNIGDGMQLEILLVGASGTERVYEGWFDAARRSSDRAWKTAAVSVHLSGTPGQSLVFRLSGGPQGDLVDDWLALSEITLSQGASGP